jgi:class 3 adenylate cyclase
MGDGGVRRQPRASHGADEDRRCGVQAGSSQKRALRREPELRSGDPADGDGDRHPRRAALDPRPDARARNADRKDEAAYIAGRIPQARLVEHPGPDYFITLLRDELYDEIERFVRSLDAEAEPETVLATVLFTDIVGSTQTAAELGDRAWAELVSKHHALVRRNLDAFRGVEIDTAGDGFFASFEGPIRAIRCARAIRDGLRSLGLEIRAGLHTGECERVDGKIGGLAVNIGARVAANAAGGEVLVSSTVRDLVAGSGIEFEDRGVHHLKGVPGEWRLFAVA